MKNIVKFAVSNPVTICMVVLAILLLGKISYFLQVEESLIHIFRPGIFHCDTGRTGFNNRRNLRDIALTDSHRLHVLHKLFLDLFRRTLAGLQLDEQPGIIQVGQQVDTQLIVGNLSQQQDGQHDHTDSDRIAYLIGMSHQNITDMAELRKVAESYIRNELIRLEGVAEVTLSGQEESTLTIRTDPYKLDAFGLKIEDIASRIEANNQSISGGRVSELGLQYLVKSSSLFGSEEDFENLIVGYKQVAKQETGTNASAGTATASGDKAPLFLREVATVTFENARPDNIVRINGKRSIGLSIYKEMRYNTVKVVDGVSRQLGVIEQALPGYQFKVITNQGTFIKNAIGEVKDSAVLGIVLAVVVLFVFLRRFGTAGKPQ